jgi:flagellar biosynthesis/type III secretory pathway protein FliH
MTIAEQLHKQGRKKGREEGLKKGREEGCVAALRSLLIFKFQTLGARYEARLQAATPEEIDRYLKRLLTADSLAKVFKD